MRIRNTETTVEYGIRDRLNGEIVTDPAWRSPLDVEAALSRYGYGVEDVLTRTTTVTTSDWEAAR